MTIRFEQRWQSTFHLGGQGTPFDELRSLSGASPLWEGTAPRWCAEGNVLQWEIDLPAECIARAREIVPCLTVESDEPYGYQFTLDCRSCGGTGRAALVPVGAYTGPRSESSGSALVKPDIDLFRLEHRLDGARLSVTLSGIGARELENRSWILSVSTRGEIAPALPREIPEGTPRVAIEVPPLSQMVVPEIGHRICSATCVAMVLEARGVSALPAELGAAGYCAEKDMYGVWPWSMYAASRKGALGALRFFGGWEEARSILEQGRPLVASIRYGRGEIAGVAHERESEKPAGHLVVLRGYEGNTVLVNDPGAPDQTGVARSYQLREFLEVWLNRSGLGYLFAG